jgi:peptidoglycan-N-acetylglucosamine deacetylase
LTLSSTYISLRPAQQFQSFITTSWDDGYPSDFRLAELLDKYQLKGTFYIPKNNPEHEVMPEKDIQQLAARFEIGGHTMDHVAVYETDITGWQQQVTGCYHWLSNLLGHSPVSFCFPKGQFTAATAKAVFDAGFQLARTTELFQTTIPLLPQRLIIPTSIQVFEHSRTTYCKHLLKRGRLQSLLQWFTTSAPKDLERLADLYMERIVTHGGCMHLWGHSWEIDEYQLWKKLELVFKRIAQISEIRYIENKEILSSNP